MTAEIIALPRPRNPLLDEMMAAFNTALTLPAATSERRFHEGLGLGYGVAFGIVDRQVLDRARRALHASNIHYEFRRPNPFDDDDTLWACGVRHGYALGTSEHRTAEDCSLCGERIIPDDDDYERCDDGFFCGAGSDCSQIWHANGPHTCGGNE